MEEIKLTKLQQLELAYEFASSNRDYGETFAYVSKKDGSIVYDDYEVSGEPCPVEDIEENDDWVQIPDKIDLDLGNRLVFRFVGSLMPDDYRNIKAIFRRKGAYSRYKNYLENRGKLKEWYKFEESETRKALLDWCKVNDIPIKE
jgi:hypothetical protein